MKRVRILAIVMVVLGAGLICEIRAGMFDNESRAVLEQIRSTIDKHLESRPIEPIPEPVQPKKDRAIIDSPVPMIEPIPEPVKRSGISHVLMNSSGPGNQPTREPAKRRSHTPVPDQLPDYQPVSNDVTPPVESESQSSLFSSQPSPGPQVTPGPASMDLFQPAPINHHDRSCIVLRIKCLPVTNLTQALNQTFQMESQFDPLHGIVFVPEATSNSLLMSGPEKKIEEARRLVEQMDHPPTMVRLKVRITEVAKKSKPEEAFEETPPADSKDTKESPKAEPAAEEENNVVLADVTTLDNQTADVFMGVTEPRIINANVTAHGMVNNVTQVAVGTRISMTPRIEPENRVVLNVDIQDSRSGPEEEGVVVTEVNGKTIRSPKECKLTAKTTLSLEDGKPVLLGSLNRDGKNGREKKIFVTAHILRPGENSAKKEQEK